MSSAVKNAVDWASRPRGAAAIAGKPAAVIAATGSPRAAQWAREDGVKVLKVAGADVIEDTVGVGSSFQAFVDGRLVRRRARRRPAHPDGPAGRRGRERPRRRLTLPLTRRRPRTDTMGGDEPPTRPLPAPIAEALLAFDREHVWHPYSSALTPQDPYLVESAHGIRLRLRDRDGEPREVVDAMSSWWCADPRLRRARARRRRSPAARRDVARDVRRADPRARDRAGRRLVDLAPDGLEHVFLADSGLGVGRGRDEDGAAVAPARPAAGAPASSRSAAATTATPSRRCRVTDPVGGMHALFRGVLPEHVFAPRPPGGLDRTRRPRAGRLGARDPGACPPRTRDERGRRHRRAGAAGRRRHARLQPAACLRVLHELARRARAAASSTTRSRPASAAPARSSRPSDRPASAPDILCVGKALTGGYLTLAAVLCTARGGRGRQRREAGGLMHGPTFMGNPLACAVASANLDLLAAATPAAEVARIERGLTAGLARRGIPASASREVRMLGRRRRRAAREPVDVAEATAAALERGRVGAALPRPRLHDAALRHVATTTSAPLTSGLVGAVQDVHG